jgi:hypothetical protein
MFMSIQSQRRTVDWKAALWAGLISGFVFLATNMMLSLIYLQNAWLAPRLFASLVMGENVLVPPLKFDLSVFAVAIGVNQILSIPFASLIAYCLHRWGIVVGIVGGALFGLALYGINIYAMSNFFPQFFALKNGLLLTSHIIFGAAAGGIYELLETELEAT